MRRRISIRGRVRPSVCGSIRPVLFSKVKSSKLDASCAVYQALFALNVLYEILFWLYHCNRKHILMGHAKDHKAVLNELQ